MRIPLMKYIASYLAFAMFILGIVPRVDAGFVPSEIITHPQIDRTADLQKIQKVLETKMVRETRRLDIPYVFYDPVIVNAIRILKGLLRLLSSGQ
jgi:hypothetical protein